MKLSKRLETILDMCPHGVAADVGSDHGKLIMSLFLEGKISHGYAIENKKGPFERLVKALEEEKLINDIIPLFSDGISDIPKSVDILIIAGMGGNTIVDILKKDVSKLKYVQTIIIDAHTCIPLVRKEISDLGFVIADEKIINEDNIYYEIIKFIRSDVAFYNDSDIEFGPILKSQKPLAFREKYERRLLEIDMLLKSKELPKSKINALLKEKERIRGIL